MRILLFTLLLLTVVDGLTLTTLKPKRSTPPSKSSTTPSSADAFLPEQMTVTLKMPRQVIELNLTKNLNTPSDVPVIVARNGTYTNWTQSKPNSDQFAAYYDVISNASVVVEVKTENQKPKKLFRGLFSIDGVFYSIYPSDNNLYHAMNSTTEEIMVQIDGAEHNIMQENSSMDAYDVLETTKLKENLALMSVSPLYQVSGFQRYVVEVCFFIDYALYYRWYSRSQAYDHWGRYSDAVLNLHYYFVQIANGMDMRYSSIKHPDYSINIRLVGVVIATTPGDSIWTETSDVKLYFDSETYVNMYKALASFEKWLPKQIPIYGLTFDQATLFSGYKMFDGEYCNGVPCSASGLADIGGICQLGSNVTAATSASICKEAGLYADINTAAHELGHNLGAKHDGYENCNSADQYLMAKSPRELTTDNFNNPFTFSSCSMLSFRNTLASITMKGQGNCLLVGSSAPTVVAPPNFAAFPGMQYSADQQCQNLYGPGSYYCAGGFRDQTICRSMECWVPSKRKCFAAVEQRAADGTKCGNKKWCLNGQCVYDSRSAPAPDTCVYGDCKDLIDTGLGTAMSCYDMGRLHPYRCYDNRTNADCCQTCSSIRDPTKPATCCFGDRNPSYCQSPSNKKYHCYDSNFAGVCCDFCLKRKVNLPECEYGNKVEWCSTSHSEVCYTATPSTCCETCQKYYTGTLGCEYGDKAFWCSAPTTSISAETCQGSTGSTCCSSCRRYLSSKVLTDGASWCSTIFAGQCYDPSVASTCQLTCSRSERNNPNCMYGNRYRWCKVDYCNTNQKDCCEVCS